jgi:putative hydrolase of the HAD superfamily
MPARFRSMDRQDAARLSAIGFDADDTLWHNERFFRLTQERFAELLADHAEQEHIAASLLEAERRNLRHYGFGIKGFTLSMIETAIEITGGKVPASTIGQILEAGREMHSHPVETLPGAADTLETLAGTYKIVLITKGDLFDQERKLAASGLGDFFDAVEIVTDKTASSYEQIFAAHSDGPEKGLMIGNSLKSDVIPALQAGSFGVHIPHELTWELEHADSPDDHPRFHRLSRLDELPDLIRKIEAP